MPNIEIRTLGTASGLPTEQRFSQTIVLTQHTLEAGESHFILDCGDGASALLRRYGYNHGRIRGIFVSHMHADHHAGMIQLIKTAMHPRYAGRRARRGRLTTRPHAARWQRSSC